MLPTHGALESRRAAHTRFTRDDAWFSTALAYLEENDPFLFDLATKELTVWEPYIAKRLAAEDAAQKAKAAQPEQKAPG